MKLLLSLIVLGRFKHHQQKLVCCERRVAVDLAHARQPLAGQLEVRRFRHPELVLCLDLWLSQLLEDIGYVLGLDSVCPAAVDMSVDAFHLFEEGVEHEDGPDCGEELFKVAVLVFPLVKQSKDALSDRVGVVDAKHFSDLAEVKALDATAAVLFLEQLVGLEHIV